MMEPVSATIITHNEETNIRQALESLGWADEIVVVDSGSTDATVDICREYTDRIHQRAWPGYVEQKNFAVQQSRHDWIFSLDADERVSPALRLELERLRMNGLRRAGYSIPRVVFFMGRWIRHGNWYPDYQLRFFDRRQARWRGGRVHESVMLDRGEPGVLNGEIEHFTYRDLSAYLGRLESYSRLAAADYLERGRRSGPFQLLAYPFAAFLKGYFLKRGLLDGVPGLMVAAQGAISAYFKYAKLYELQKR
jgi:glycosyltransferase involved in cell wall biosynthesis